MRGRLEALDLVDVVEGRTRFRVPRSNPTKGPKARDHRPFYNPAMRLARDVSVLVARAVARERARPLTVCDAMASLGARGLRIANEVPNTDVLLNDGREDSSELAAANAKALGLSNVRVRHGPLQTLLDHERFDWVDLDPFGTPAEHLDVAAAAVNEGGVWAVTATDKATLCGVYPDLCLQRYGARPLHGVLMWEVAARILVAAMARAAQRHGRSLRPLLSHSTNHYVRVYAQVLDDPASPPLGYAWIREDMTRGLMPQAPADARAGGPLWTAPLCDPAFVRGLLRRLEPEAPGDVRRRIALLEQEADAPPLYYTIDEFTRKFKFNAPRLDRFVERLRAQGWRAARTHFTPRAFKTDAPVDAIESSLRAVD